MRLTEVATSDGELVLAAQRGDAPAFGQLYARYAPVVRSILLGRLAAADADDALQEVFMTAHAKLESLREPAAFAGWIARIARNRAEDFRRGASETMQLDRDYAARATQQESAEAARALAAIRAYRASGWRAGALSVYRAGDTIRATAPLRLETPSIGVVDVAAGTTLHVIGKSRLALDAGTIHARTTSPPGLFIVDTPRAKATDLGCEYVLDVAKDGSGSLRVTAGWVALTRGWTQSLVPRGASATFDAEGMLTPPVFDDAPVAFKEAVRRHDIAQIVALARPRDALTLLNLFSRTNDEERLLVYDRLAQLVPPPAEITRQSMRWWSPGVTDAWWAPVRKASGVNAIKK